MKQEAIALANKVLHELNFDKQRTTTQIIAEALESYAEQVKISNKPHDIFSETRAEYCKWGDKWKECKSWINDARCLKSCEYHLKD